MPLILGAACSYSPLLYRPRPSWPAVRDALVGGVTQPPGAAAETPELLDSYARRVDAAFEALGAHVAAAAPAALVVLVSDAGRMFDDSNTPQLHVFVGEELWGDTARPELGEPPHRTTLRCDRALANLLAEELAYAGFDISEGRDVFRPADPERGVGPALIEPLRRLAPHIPIVPIHVNASTAPCISGHRMTPFGTAIARALELVPERVAILASGGLSGEPNGYMAGWVDDVLDRWVLGRLLTGRSAALAGMFDMDSLALRGSAQQIRLWNATGAAAEAAGLRAKLLEYIPLHHSTVGCGFMVWE